MDLRLKEKSIDRVKIIVSKYQNMKNNKNQHEFGVC